VFKEFFGIRAFGQKFDGAAEPAVSIRLTRKKFALRFAEILIECVRGDSIFRDLMHLFRADLQLDALIARPDHGGMD
jgi:hypothetical protein